MISGNLIKYGSNRECTHDSVSFQYQDVWLLKSLTTFWKYRIILSLYDAVSKYVASNSAFKISINVLFSVLYLESRPIEIVRGIDVKIHIRPLQVMWFATLTTAQASGSANISLFNSYIRALWTAITMVNCRYYTIRYQNNFLVTTHRTLVQPKFRKPYTHSTYDYVHNQGV